jgi:ABC-2 type transport system permease protein
MDLLWVGHDVRVALAWFTTDAVVNLAGAGAVFLLAERFAGIGSWSREQIVFMLGYAIVANGWPALLMGYNLLHISRRIGRGQVDHLLVQPQPLWQAFLTEGFMPLSGGLILLPGLALMVWAGRALGLAVTPGWLARLGLNLLASGTVLIAFSFLWGSLAFWAPRAAEEISSSAVDLISDLKSFPLHSATPLLAGVLLSVFPAGLVAWLPARHLLGHAPGLWDGLATPAAALLLAGLAAGAFRLGLREYARTGSQRYSDLGHRR